MPIVEWIVTMLQSGMSSLASYLAAHVLLCLVPAFFIAGAMTALTWLSNRPELNPAAADWLADHGLPASEPGKPVLLAGPVPYLDLLLDEWLAADSLADQLEAVARKLKQLVKEISGSS